MSGGANPPKNLGQNVTKMTFGDIEVKAETSPKAEVSIDHCVLVKAIDGAGEGCCAVVKKA